MQPFQQVFHNFHDTSNWRRIKPTAPKTYAHILCSVMNTCLLPLDLSGSIFVDSYNCDVLPVFTGVLDAESLSSELCRLTIQPQ